MNSKRLNNTLIYFLKALICTGFLLRVLVSEVSKVQTAKSTVSIKSTGLKNSERFLLSVPYITKNEDLNS